jgi:hypothetical protein
MGDIFAEINREKNLKEMSDFQNIQGKKQL